MTATGEAKVLLHLRNGVVQLKTADEKTVLYEREMNADKWTLMIEHIIWKLHELRDNQ